MKIGDEVVIHGYVDEIRKDLVIIRNNGGYFGTPKSEVITVGELKDMGRWIPCAEKLPDKPDTCIVTVRGKDGKIRTYYENAEYDEGRWNDVWGGEFELEVLAWMYLPKPYEGENDG